MDELLQEEPDSMFAPLRDLRSQLAKDFRDRAPVTRLTTITLQSGIPAAVLAHRLYGDATRADEIVARNKLSHPLFVPADESLEVLNG
jgi:prophage DNA circulation protein